MNKARLLKDEEPGFIAIWGAKNLGSFEEAKLNDKQETWWKCGQGLHDEYPRRRDSQIKCKGMCPNCASNTRRFAIKPDNITITHPDKASHWDYENNGKLLPTMVTMGSEEVVFWVCDNGHRYEKRIAHEIGAKFKPCPTCSRRLHLIENNFITLYPQFVPYISKFNGKIEEIRLGQSHPIIVQCQQSQEHTYPILPRNLAAANKFECSMCKQKRIIRGINDYITLYPFLLPLIDYKLSPVLADEELRVRTKLFWRCPAGKHDSFERTVGGAINLDGRCRLCSLTSRKPVKRVSKLELSILGSITEKLETTIIHSHRLKREKRAPLEIDIYLPDLNKAVEVNGDYWHSDKLCQAAGYESARERHLIKLQKAKSLGIDLAFVWEHDWKKDQSRTLDTLVRWLTDKDKSAVDYSMLQRLESTLDLSRRVVAAPTGQRPEADTFVKS